MRFMHMSDKENIKFIEPTLEEYDHRNTLNPGGCMFLSKLNEDGRTDWQDSRASRDVPESYWQSGYKYVYDVDMGKILIINTEYDIITFFSKYGVKSKWEPYSEEIKELRKQIVSILYFLETLNQEKKDIIKDTEKMLEHIEKFKNNCIEVKIVNDMVVIPKQGANIKFICSVFTKLKKLYDKIGEYYKVQLENDKIYSTVNYIKLREDGYSGIYYTKKIISNAKSSINMDVLMKNFMTWLDADTLIVWKEDALSKVN